MSAAITSAYRVIAVWTPVTVVFMTLATVAIATFITDVSSVIRNCAEQSVTRTSVAPAIATFFASDPSTVARAYWNARPIQDPTPLRTGPCDRRSRHGRLQRAGSRRSDRGDTNGEGRLAPPFATLVRASRTVGI